MNTISSTPITAGGYLTADLVQFEDDTFVRLKVGNDQHLLLDAKESNKLKKFLSQATPLKQPSRSKGVTK